VRKIFLFEIKSAAQTQYLMQAAETGGLSSNLK
jgi:hypothetical protein